jgi:4'-phosphopantetheinyl transferase
VRLWRLELDVGDEAAAALLAALPAAEAARAAGFTDPEARRRYTVTRGALRTLLGSLLGQRPGSLSIETGPSGKPRLGGAGRGFHFNVSHSGELALICVAATGPVGVDLERVRPIPSAIAMAKRRFAEAEARFVEEGDPAGADRRFLRCWTRKEAMLKAIGTGLDSDLAGFTVPLTEAGGTVSTGGSGSEPVERWLLLDVPLGQEHVAALALPASAAEGGSGPAEELAQAEPGDGLEGCEEIDLRGPLARAAASRTLAGRAGR